MDFTFTEYRHLITALREKGYVGLTFAEYLRGIRPERFVMLRHDVDLKPGNSLAVAWLEKEEGMKASYYFRAVPESWDEAVIKEIAALGHEVGYHYESLTTCHGDLAAAYQDFQENLGRLKEFAPVETICMHGSPKSPWDSRDLWKQYNYRFLGILGEPYFDVDFSDVFYLTDTGRRWDGFKVSVRDRIPEHQDRWCREGLVYHSTQDIIEALQNGSFPKHAMFTTHPQRWTGKPVPWIKEIILQNAKNAVKREILRFAQNDKRITQNGKMTILTDSLHRIAYSTDASMYREVPYGVAYPETVEDIQKLVAEAKCLKTHLIPRAAGTSIAGQVVGSGIVVDIKKWNKILEINAEEKWARVQPGVVRDELNMALKPYGLFFSPETSTSNRCCIGGMFGNNSCGTHSLLYGSTRHHVLACKGVLSDGSLFDTEKPDPGNKILGQITAQLQSWADDPEATKAIEEAFPDKSLRRRSCGYAIDEAIGQGTIDLCKLLAGSEGTLAFITEIKVSLDPLPPAEKMVVCAHCDTLEKSFLANLVALEHHPAAVELMDGKILELSFQNLELQRNAYFVDGHPAALLMTEFWADTQEEMDTKAVAFEKAAHESGLVYTCTRVYGAEVSKVWDLRKAGLGVLSGMKGDAKPVSVIEDSAVAPDRLPAYMKDFGEMMQKLGTSCVYYGHISTGELHLRPILNLKTPEGRKHFREVAFEMAQLVKKHKGSLSGEHGDGRLRGEFIPLMYGDTVYQMMREVKQTWDPDGVFNMHKIVDTPPMDEWLRFAVGQNYAVEEALCGNKTYYNWRAAFDECRVEGASGVRSQAHALMCSVEQCNGAGACLKSNLIGGTLCPAYKVSADETRSTRARANVIREVLTRSPEIFESQELAQVLDSCLACKGCLSECPSNVDITRLRSEILQQKYLRHGTPFRSWMVARMARMEALGAAVRPLYNFFATWKPSSALIKKLVHFSADRQIPTLSRYSMRKLVAREPQPASGRKVYLFADEFTNYQEAELGLTFARLLIRLGYRVEIPSHVESGRAAISKGCLKLARQFAVKNVRMLSGIVADDTPLIGIEPSCILSFRDEYPDLVPPEMRADAKRLAANCLLFDEFILREAAAGRIGPEAFLALDADIYLHGHCHQKSLIGVGKCADMLRLIPGARVHVIPSGCCGMAGSFGYEKEHYETSMAIGEMVLFPAVRKATQKPGVLVAAPGTSCRQQILDGTGVKAVHPIEILHINLK